jgi:hypothetical protein
MNLRKLILATALPAALVLVGCGPTTSTGGTQNKTTDAKGNEKTVNEKVEIKGPPGSPYGIKQGESKNLDFSLDRGSDLKDDVQLTVEKPEKLMVEAPKTVPAAGDGKFVVKVSAADDTPVAEHTVKITAKTGKGNPAVAEFKVKVDKK